MEGDLGFSHAPEAELKDRKILQICRKKEEEETNKSAEERVPAAVEAELRSLLPLRLLPKRRRQKKICERRKKGDATGLMAGPGNGKVITITSRKKRKRRLHADLEMKSSEGKSKVKLL